MLTNIINKEQWLRIGLFILSCALGLVSILKNKIEVALIASLIMCFAFCVLKKRITTEENQKLFKNFATTPDQLVLAVSLFFYAVIVGGIATFLSTKLASGIIALILWIISIGLLISIGYVFDGVKPFTWVKNIKKLRFTIKKSQVIEVVIVVIITAIALVLRVTKLNLYPTSVHGDEGEMGMEALRFLGIGDPISPFGVGWGPLPNLFYLFQAGSISIFGRNPVGLRMVSALIGTACIPLVYLIGKKCWGKIAGVAGAWLIAVSHFHIQYSRLGIINIVPAFFILLFLYLFLKENSLYESTQGPEISETDSNRLQQKKHNITPYIVMGVVGGLAQYMYIYSLLIPLVAFPLFIVQLFRKRVNIVQLAILGICAILVYAPLGVHYIQRPDQLTTRVNTVSIFSPENIHNNYGADATLSDSWSKILVSQFKKNLEFFLQAGDRGSFYYTNIPVFDKLTTLLFWLGLGVILSRPRRLSELTLLLWFLFGIIFGGVITNDSPNGTRLLITTSVVFLAGGVFIQRTWDAINSTYKRIPNIHLSLGWLYAPIFLAAMVATFLSNYNYNFVVYPKAGINILSVAIANEINLDAPDNHIYLFGEGDLYSNHGTLRFLAGGKEVIDINKLEDLPPESADSKGITVLATYSNFEEISPLTSLYPQGVLSDEYRDGQLVFKKFQIPAKP